MYIRAAFSKTRVDCWVAAHAVNIATRTIIEAGHIAAILADHPGGTPIATTARLILRGTLVLEAEMKTRFISGEQQRTHVPVQRMIRVLPRDLCRNIAGLEYLVDVCVEAADEGRIIQEVRKLHVELLEDQWA